MTDRPQPTPAHTRHQRWLRPRQLLVRQWLVVSPWPRALGIVGLLGLVCAAESFWLFLGWTVLLLTAEYHDSRQRPDVTVHAFVLSLTVAFIVAIAFAIGVLALLFGRLP